MVAFCHEAKTFKSFLIKSRRVIFLFSFCRRQPKSELEVFKF